MLTSKNEILQKFENTDRLIVLLRFNQTIINGINIFIANNTNNKIKERNLTFNLELFM